MSELLPSTQKAAPPPLLLGLRISRFYQSFSPPMVPSEADVLIRFPLIPSLSAEKMAPFLASCVPFPLVMYTALFEATNVPPPTFGLK